MAARYVLGVPVDEVERAVVGGITDALRRHGVDVPGSSDDSDDDTR